MKKLCFASFATVLIRCKVKSTTQKQLCGTVLLSIAPTYDIREEDGTTSDLILGRKNLSVTVTSVALKTVPDDISKYFKQYLLPLLDNNKRQQIVLALKDIIASDDSIKSETIIDSKNNMTKKDINNRTAFVLADFLAGILLYTLINVNNRNCNKYIKEITEEYLQSFDTQDETISFLTAYANFSMETASEIAIDSHALSLLTETGGTCQKCSRPLGIKKGGSNINYAKVVHLSDSDDVVLCVDCEREFHNASESEKLILLNYKHRLENLVAARDATSRYTLETQIKEVLCNIDALDASDATQLKTTPVKVEKKITEKRLKERILFDVIHFYEGVNTTLDQLSGENKLNVDQFAKNIKRMYEDASESLTSQSDIYYLLVDMLYVKNNRKYKEACEIIISYFVQRCEVFDEIAE